MVVVEVEDSPLALRGFMDLAITVGFLRDGRTTLGMKSVGVG